ncbi:MAG: 7-cyano-7-deazaguanine synthase QueC [Planctomycetota bacterium]
MKSLSSDRALVLLSGGQDSCTCLHWALKKYKHVEALSVDYGQLHKRELDCAKALAQSMKVPWKKISLPLGGLSESTLLENTKHDRNSPHRREGDPADGAKLGDDGLPLTFVPGRNLLFLVAAGAVAYTHECGVLVTGVCQTDYSGYPDCRDNTMRSMEKTLQLGLECDIRIETPLMNLTKAQTVLLLKDLGGLASLAHTHTCYAGAHPPCGVCVACELRAKGFKEAGIPDPLTA